MRKLLILTVSISVLLSLFGCSKKEAPLDNNGNSPEQVMMETYKKILTQEYENALENFSDEYVQEFMTSKNVSFEDYCSNTENWKTEWLKTKLVGNDYNDNIWRVKIIPDEGKGKHNGPGIVQDLHIIDGEWKIVFWGHYPKS